MNDLVLLAKAFADPTRVRIVAALRQGELCVCELSDALEITQSTLSMQLQMVRQAGLVSTRRNGKWIYYSIDPTQAKIVDALFAHHRDALKVDGRLKRDEERIQKRLKLREKGCCVLGFRQID